MAIEKPDSLKADQARNNAITRIEEVEALRDRTVASVTRDVTQTIKGVQQVADIMANAPAGTFTADEAAFPVAILDDLSANVDALSASLKSAITAAKGS